MKYFTLLASLVLLNACTNNPAGNEHAGTPNDTIQNPTKPAEKPDSTASYSYNNLSNQFDIQVFAARYHSIDDHHDSCIVKLVLTDKLSQTPLDSIQLTSISYLDNFFFGDTNVSSYSTGFNLERAKENKAFGDIVIADLNFDNKDDIAVINDVGGSSGAQYTYYLQNNESNFVANSFLTDSIQFFPEIKPQQHQLVTYRIQGTGPADETKYIYQLENGVWREVFQSRSGSGD